VLQFSVLILSAIVLGGVRVMLRRRRARDTAAPKLDPVSSDWLAEARGRHEHTP
jgi:hypothetical protein